MQENEEDKENELNRRRRRVFFSLLYKRFRFLQRYPRAACTQLCAGPLIVLSVLLLVTFFSSYSSLYGERSLFDSVEQKLGGPPILFDESTRDPDASSDLENSVVGEMSRKASDESRRDSIG